MKKLFGYLVVVFLFVGVSAYACDFYVPLDQGYFKDGKIDSTTIAPGDVICIEAGERSYLKFIGLQGTPENPIIIKNHNGVVDIKSDHSYGFSLENCHYVNIVGGATEDQKYGFKIKAPNAGVVMSVGGGSSDVEVSGVEIYGNSIDDSYTAFAAKTDPKCSSAFVRGKFEMKNISFHDSYIHDLNQGLYFGRTFFDKKIDCPEGIIQGHTLQGVKIYNNIIERVGQDGMQISSATSTNGDCLIYDNLLKNTSLKNLYGQRSAITIGGGSKCSVYNNISLDSNGPGVLFFGYAGEIYNNLIINAGKAEEKIDGIFVDHRSGDEYIGGSLDIYDNTIVSPARNGIRFYNKFLINNQIHNNLFVNPGAIKTTHPNHRSMKELGSYLYFEKGRIDRNQINNGADISSYLSTGFLDNLALKKIDNSTLDKVRRMKKFGAIEYQKLVKDNDNGCISGCYVPTQKDIQFVEYFIKLLKDKYPEKIDGYKVLLKNMASNYREGERIRRILVEISNKL